MRSFGFGLASGLLSLAALLASPTAQAKPGPITATDAWFRYLLPQIPAGGFVTLHNAGPDPVTLTGVETPACGMAMLHKSVTRSGVERMEMIGTITVPAHGSFRFSPGAYHIMCMQPTMKPGETVIVSLSFQNAPRLAVPFDVYGADGKPTAK
jgi:copper(I)-binding protein